MTTSLTTAQRKELFALLEAGVTLPAEWRQLLFPLSKKECELVYDGKTPETTILSDTLALPLQPIRAFGRGENESWHNRLILGNNLQVLRTLVDEKRAGKLLCADGTPGVRLVYIDPPFATEQEFSGNQHVVAYRDKVAGAEFLEFLRKRFVLLRELLTDDGSIFVHLDTRKVHAAKLLLDEVFGEGRFQNEIIWQRTDPHNNATSRLGKVHDTVLWYSRGDRPVYNALEVAERLSQAATKEYSLCRLLDGTTVPWDASLEGKGRRFKLDDLTVPHPNPKRQFEWRGARPSSKRSWPADTPQELDAMLDEGLLYLRNPKKGAARCKVSFHEKRDAEGQLLQDIWLNCGRMKGGSSYPTEKPELLLERVIKAASNPGDLVLDAFAGSGTTCAVAEKTGRRWVGIDRGKLSIYTIQKRLLNLTGKIGKQAGVKQPVSPFVLYHAGLYDYSKLKDLPWDAWRFFALQLFQCRDACHSISGIEFDGYLRGSSVLVFRHRDVEGALFTRESLEDLHGLVSDKVGSKVYIVAPSLSFGFQESCIVLDDVKYYALRIPYSLVEELHKKKFTALTQPMTKDAINDTVESEGFDFIQVPEVAYKTKFSVDGQNLKGSIVLTTFKSTATVREPVNRIGNLETLSMVMLDLDYGTEGDPFEVDAVHYGAALKESAYRLDLPPLPPGRRVMAVFVDVYGNEAREVVTVPELPATRSTLRNKKR